MKIDTHFILRILLIATVILLGWYFSDILLYLFFAFVFSLIGRPIAHKISSLRIGRLKVSYTVGAGITMLLFVCFFALVLIVIIPMLISEIQTVVNIDYTDLAADVQVLISNIQTFLHSKGVLSSGDTLVEIITAQIKTFVNFTSFSKLLGDFLGATLSATGTVLFALFCILFFTFFFIKDEFNPAGLARLIFGSQRVVDVTSISEKISNMLSRYFIGLVTEVFCMIVLLYIGLLIFGVKGALLFAVFGGILNMVPYLGPIIGCVACCLFGTINCMSINDYQSIFSTIIQIAGVFIGANLLDNFVLQPLIYSQSLEVHPVEIFIVVIMGGSIAGIIGMVVAIPVYAIIRTITVELVRFMNAK